MHKHDMNSFMQVALSAARRGAKKEDSGGGNSVVSETCTDLANKGAYFTVEVGVGTPEQRFNLVADTGSDALIIPDCKCVKSGNCESPSSCFTATKSTSFGLDIKPSKGHKHVSVMGAKM